MRKHVLVAITILCIFFTSCSTPTNISSASNEESIAQHNATDNNSTLTSTTTPSVVIVPDVVGMDKDEAVELLEGLGLKG